MTEQTITAVQVDLVATKRQYEGLLDQYTAILDQRNELLEALRGFLRQDPEWEGHFIQCSGGHGDRDEPPPTQRCTRAMAAVEKAEGS